MEKFVLAITRTCGSGGTTIGSMLAKEYQIGLYDRQLMSLASEDSGISEALFASADESVKNTLLYKVSKGVFLTIFNICILIPCISKVFKCLTVSNIISSVS